MGLTLQFFPPMQPEALPGDLSAGGLLSDSDSDSIDAGEVDLDAPPPVDPSMLVDRLGPRRVDREAVIAAMPVGGIVGAAGLTVRQCLERMDEVHAKVAAQQAAEADASAPE